MNKTKQHKTGVAVAPFPFVCTLCKKPVDVGFLLDKGHGRLDLTCAPCANNYIYVEKFVLPSGLPGLNFNDLASEVKGG